MADHSTQGPSPHEQEPAEYDPNEVIADLVAHVDPTTTEEFFDIYPELAGVNVEALHGEEAETAIPVAPEEDVHEDEAPAIEMADPDDPDQVVQRQPRVTGHPDEDAAIRAARLRVLAERRRVEIMGGDADDMGYKLD